MDLNGHYTVFVKTPFFSFDVSSEDVPTLLQKLCGALADNWDSFEKDIDLIAEEVFRDVKNDRNMRLRKVPLGKIPKNGIDKDVIKCFLRGMSYADTINRIQEETGVKLSTSTLGRYYQRLCRLGAKPL